MQGSGSRGPELGTNKISIKFILFVYKNVKYLNRELLGVCALNMIPPNKWWKNCSPTYSFYLKCTEPKANHWGKQRHVSNELRYDVPIGSINTNNGLFKSHAGETQWPKLHKYFINCMQCAGILALCYFNICKNEF